MADRSKLEIEISKATKVKQGDKEKRLDFLIALADAGSDLPDEKWGELSKDAQTWINDAAKAVNDSGGKSPKVKDFPAAVADAEPDEPAPRTRRGRAAEPEAEPEAPAHSRRRAAAEEPEAEPEAEAPARGRRGRGAAAEAPEAEPEAPARSRRRAAAEEPEPEAPARGRRRAAEEPEAEAEAPRVRNAKGKDKPPASKTSSPAAANKGAGVKDRIKDLIIDNPEISVDEIVKKLGKAGTVSKITVSNIRAEFRHSLRRLADRGWPKVKV